MLAYKMTDGTKKPIAFVLRTLTKSEQRYAQIEREGLACAFGVTKFHAYLYGCNFTLITDHKPLASLFSEHQAVPTQDPQECSAGHGPWPVMNIPWKLDEPTNMEMLMP